MHKKIKGSQKLFKATKEKRKENKKFVQEVRQRSVNSKVYPSAKQM